MIINLPLMLCELLLLPGCGYNSAKTVIEMKMMEGYDDEYPFINDKLFYVSHNVDILKLDVTFQMEGSKSPTENKKLLTVGI